MAGGMWEQGAGAVQVVVCNVEFYGWSVLNSWCMIDTSTPWCAGGRRAWWAAQEV